MYCQFARSSFECGIFVRRKNNIISIGRNTDRTGEKCCDDLRIFIVNHKELEVLMHLMNIEHHFLFRRIQAACNSLFLDIADFLSRKTVIKKEISRKDHVLQEFHALVTRNFREEHFVSFYADKLAISEQYLARIVRLGTGKTINSLINELLVMEARTLLSSTKFTVGEIAAKLGFSDAAGFCKFFKRNAGQTPLNYRKGLLI